MNQSSVHKKKPRIRNRQRNKINQLHQDQEEDLEETTVQLKTAPKSDDSREATPFESVPPLVKSSTKGGISLVETLFNNSKVEIPQESDTIRLIQELLRRKLLAKNSAAPISKSEPITVQAKLVSPPKEIKSEKEKPKISSALESSKVPAEPKTSGKALKDVKADEMDELLKCLGTKLQKG